MIVILSLYRNWRRSARADEKRTHPEEEYGKIEAGIGWKGECVAARKKPKTEENLSGWVMDKLKEIVEQCMTPEPVKNKQGEDTGQYSFRTAEALKALELIGKLLDLHPEMKGPEDGGLSEDDRLLLANVACRMRGLDDDKE